jgi:hypothetical protein
MAEGIERMPEEEVRGGVRKGPATAYKKSELGAVKFPVRPVSWRMQGSFAEEGTGEALSGSWQGAKGSCWGSSDILWFSYHLLGFRPKGSIP